MQTQLLSQPEGDSRLGDFLLANLRDTRWTAFRAAVAFVKQAGADQVGEALTAFAQRAQVKISVGVSFGGTSLEGLTRLSEALGNRGEIWIFHNCNGSTFHPKVYLFKNDQAAYVAIGSGNLTQGGLFTNYEAGCVLQLDLNTPEDQETLTQIEASLDEWSSPDNRLAHLLDDDFLNQLTIRGYLPPEVYSRETEEAGASPGQVGAEETIEEETPLFGTIAVQPAPRRISTRASPIVTPAGSGTTPTVFLMTLQFVDLSRGQRTTGAQERSPEVYIPLIARNAVPTFWGWPTAFTEDTATPGKLDRFNVRMLIGTSVEEVTMTYFPHKHEFRLRSRALQNSGGQPGDILRIEKTDGNAGYEYHITIVPQGTHQYAAMRTACAQTVRNSPKEWGYI